MSIFDGHNGGSMGKDEQLRRAALLLAREIDSLPRDLFDHVKRTVYLAEAARHEAAAREAERKAKAQREETEEKEREKARAAQREWDRANVALAAEIDERIAVALNLDGTISPTSPHIPPPTTEEPKEGTNE